MKKTIDDDTPKSPEDILFGFLAMRGDDRLPLLDPENITHAARLSRRDPALYLKFQGRMTGWTHAAAFNKAVNKRLSDADAKKKKREAEEATKARLAAAQEAGHPFIAVDKPVAAARDFVAQNMPSLIFTNGDFLRHHQNAYFSLSEDRTHREVRAAVQSWMESGVNAKTGEPCNPNKNDLDRIMDALANLVFRPKRETNPPSWLDYDPAYDPDPTMVLACRNGILNLESNHLMANTPALFTLNGLSFDYDPDAPTPTKWLDFLEQVWPEAEGGAADKAALQEIMGHLLTGSTKYQKIFTFIGPGRAGKGTITRVITGLLGATNVLSQSANDLGDRFGLESLIGKSVMIVPDLRFGKHADFGAITEKLLTISGEDNQSIQRKNKTNWEGHLNCRFVISANKEILLPDQAGAFAMRLVPLEFRKGFDGREDVRLTQKLLVERTGILNWALEGLRRLEARVDEHGNQRGFVLTPNGEALLATVRAQGSPVREFIGQCCDVTPDAHVSKDGLFEAFEGWCSYNDVDSRRRLPAFARELMEARRGEIGKARPYIKGTNEREQVFTGIMLKPEFVGCDWGAAL